ncbi:MAG: DNA-binding transcriptional MerR regulator [Planctomycetota bacterium]|jgi:DNA-binding transcriptional MerR regulator
MFSIGEFSGLTSLSVKTLRYYHEKGLLLPSTIDEETGYRYYNASCVDRARVILRLKALGFSIVEITKLLDDFDDDGDILEYLRNRREILAGRIQNDREIIKTLNHIVETEEEARMIMSESKFEIVEKTLEPQLIAGFRMTGQYKDIGKGFSKVGSAMGFNIKGKALGLFYDAEYKEDGADLEACMPVRKHKDAKGVDVREIPGGRATTLLHSGPYDTIGRSYEKIMKHTKDLGLTIIRPSREVYIKGPGMIFKGNPEKYITEIQLLVE